MVIQWKKGRDGPPNLTCLRSDGTRTWRKVHPFFAVHDLAHCNVESIFGFTQAFFGLIASGWSIEEFEHRGAAGRLPDEALWAEHMVGLLDLERATGHLMSAAELSAALAAALEAEGRGPFRPVTERELARVHGLIADLQGQWQRVPLGQTLELRFPIAAAAA
jgi:hypothetical protein